jgi:hypothetical protein
VRKNRSITGSLAGPPTAVQVPPTSKTAIQKEIRNCLFVGYKSDVIKDAKLRRVGSIGFWIIVSALLVSITINTMEYGPDFLVYWKAVMAVFTGGTAYSIQRDGIMTFKYPPWILPVFLPLGVLTVGSAKILWGILESCSLFWVICWCQQQGVKLRTLLAVLILFVPILNVHALDGQASLLLTAICLFSWETFSKEHRGVRAYLLAYVLNLKVVTPLRTKTTKGRHFKSVGSSSKLSCNELYCR